MVFYGLAIANYYVHVFGPLTKTISTQYSIRVYDQTRAIDSAKRRGKSLGKEQPVVSELFFGEPDDPLIMSTARAMLDCDERWNKR